MTLPNHEPLGEVKIIYSQRGGFADPAVGSSEGYLELHQAYCESSKGLWYCLEKRDPGNIFVHIRSTEELEQVANFLKTIRSDS